MEQNEEFSYDGYQVVRGEFFAHINEPSVTFNAGTLSPNAAAVNKLPDVMYVQVMVNPETKKLALRPCKEEDKDAFRWSLENKKNGRRKPRKITCRLFFAKMTDLMQWNPEYKYKMLGKLVQSNGEHLFVFDLTATEVYTRAVTNDQKIKTAKAPIFPADWKNQFGLPIEEHKKQLKINIFDGFAVIGMGKDEENANIDADRPEEKPNPTV